MKKNLVSVLILALLIVNVVLTAIMMFSVTSSSTKTAALVDDIASALSLELHTSADSVEEEKPSVSIADTAMYDIEDEFTIPLKKAEDGAEAFAILSVSLSMNTKDKGYKKYGETVADYESKIKNIIIDVIGSYTKDEVSTNNTEMLNSIVSKIQTMYDSEFIYEVVIRDIIVQ